MVAIIYPLAGEFRARESTIPAVVRFFLFLWLAAAMAAPPDAAIEKRVRARLARSSLRQEEVRVQVKDGVTVLEGTVTNPQRKGVATRLAKAAGAARVENRLRISAAESKTPPRRVRVTYESVKPERQ